MTQTITVGTPTADKTINLSQLQAELVAATVDVATGLGMADGMVYRIDASGELSDFIAAQQAAVEQAIADHIALRPRTDEEYAAEFQAAETTAVRRQEIRDITSGLLPREQVRIDNGLPLEDPEPQEDPLETIKAVPLGSTTDELRDAIVAYLERFGG